MLDFVVIWLVLFVFFCPVLAIIHAAIGIIAKMVRSGEEDRPDYDPSDPPRNPLEDEGEAYLNRRPR